MQQDQYFACWCYFLACGYYVFPVHDVVDLSIAFCVGLVIAVPEYPN
jgi:hypothetical protein